ncbi:hypothetical protein YN1HA_26320 [Sulfurisphaera ohwakuensis]
MKLGIKHKGEYIWRPQLLDVSKDKLVVYFQDSFYEFPNNKQGFDGVKQLLPRGCKVGIESTGIYHINLVKYLGNEYDVRKPQDKTYQSCHNLRTYHFFSPNLKLKTLHPILTNHLIQCLV